MIKSANGTNWTFAFLAIESANDPKRTSPLDHNWIRDMLAPEHFAQIGRESIGSQLIGLVHDVFGSFSVPNQWRSNQDAPMGVGSVRRHLVV